jgi:hypothetical protein
MVDELSLGLPPVVVDSLFAALLLVKRRGEATLFLVERDSVAVTRKAPSLATQGRAIANETRFALGVGDVPRLPSGTLRSRSMIRTSSSVQRDDVRDAHSDSAASAAISSIASVCSVTIVSPVMPESRHAR